MKAIGGYFELELVEGITYHNNAISLNTGRNAFEYILKANNYIKIYLPYFTCDALLQPLKRLNLEYEFYSINENLEPIFDFSKINFHNCFLYTNYFGLKDDFVNQLSKKNINLIIDNAQSFYSEPIKNIDTFYSARKFFGVPDGSYVYCSKKIDDDLKKDQSFGRFGHLLTRIDQSAEEGYLTFVENDEKLDNQPILHMSNLTQRLLQSIDYKKSGNIRIENYLYLENHLKSVNKLKLSINFKVPPMVYPFWGTEELRTRLVENKIYVAKYWPNVYNWCAKDSLEVQLTDELLHLPIDQRYRRADMELIIKILG